MNNDKICLPKNYLLIILCVLLGISTLYMYTQKNNNIKYTIIPTSTNNDLINNNLINNNNDLINNNNNNLINNNNDLLINNNNNLNNNNDLLINNNNNLINNNMMNEDIIKRVILNSRDRNVLNDNFKPPERRLPFHAYPENIKNIINIPSRGYPDNYQLMGLVIRDNTETAYNLFGRQTYPGSNQYEYYVQRTGVNDNVKIPIQIKGNKEIEDGQEIDIIGTNKEKGSFMIKLYDYNSPRYNPFII
jgi:hypothetical protein